MTRPVRSIEKFDCSAPVSEALRRGQPVLALESTIITHGMPFPDNLETAKAAEQIVRDVGVTPATIAVLDGRIKVGLDARELTRLASAGSDVRKCSRRDLALIMTAGQTAGTTVAATMWIAALAGIEVFATGGIGGVHRGAEQTLDISADLQELAQTPVAVVCAGPKAILDIALTLEYLETHGVPVIGLGVDEMPSFYSRSSGHAVDARCDNAEQIAAVLRQQWALGHKGGAVIGNPVPRSNAMDPEKVEQWILSALDDAAAEGMTGKALTPFLLQRIEALTGGQSLITNTALLLNNARRGAEIALALAQRSAKD